MDDDPLERLELSWNAELPDLDASVMATVGRINLLAGLMKRRIEDRLGTEGSSLAEFDVLSALRRRGRPYELKPSVLARSTMLSPSGMTHRIDMLEAAGLVERVVDPDSRRTAPVRLSPRGIELSERLARAVSDIEGQLLSGLSDADRRNLDRSTSALIRSL